MSEVRAAKRLGQHFLNNGAVIDQMVAAVMPQKNQNILEIGPGLGALTLPILEKSKALSAIEFDKRVIPILKKQAALVGKLELFEGDVLNFQFTDILPAPIRVIGNLPYNLSSPILFHCFAQRENIQDIFFMLQKEVVDRIVAQPGSKTYGRLSIMAQLYCRCESLFDIPAEAFDPPPKVVSSVIKLTPHEKIAWDIKDFNTFDQIVRQAFSQRRKMIRKSLQHWFTETDLIRLNIAPTSRPESLSGAEFAILSNALALN